MIEGVLQALCYMFSYCIIICVYTQKNNNLIRMQQYVTQSSQSVKTLRWCRIEYSVG